MNHSLPYDDMHPHYPDSFTADSAAESRYPSQMHPHPLFTRQGNAPYNNNNNNNNPPSPFTTWDNPSYPQAYNYPSHSPFPAPRLSPPPTHHTPGNFKSPQAQNQRLTLAGSLDPSTGIFYRTPEHPRLRTAQACEKCRTRKAKCSGEHPTCKRCLTRGLICEYAKEGRVRGPNKAKSKANIANDTSSNTPVNNRNGQDRIGPRDRTPSATSSVDSSERPDTPGIKNSFVKPEQQDASPRCDVESAGRNSLSLGEHRSSRPRPPDLQLASASGIPYRSSMGGGLNDLEFHPFPPYRSQGEYGQVDSRQVRSMHQPQMSYHQRSPYQLHRDQHILPQKNMSVIQSHSQGQLTSSSSSPQGRLLHAMSHTPTDQLMNLGMPYSVSPLQSPMSEEFMYPSPAYLQQHHSFPQYSMRNVSNNPISATTCGSSPHTSVSGGTSAINSPLTPAPAPPFLISPSASRIGIKMDIDMTSVDPALHGSRSGELGGTIPLEPVWIDHLGNTYSHMNSNTEILGADERGQNGLSTPMGVMDGSMFVKNGQSQVDVPQDHFHGQSHDQSHNDTHHYPALDLQMC